jgi:hypothetical protein
MVEQKQGGQGVIVITVQPNGWSCSCDNDAFFSTITGSSAARGAWLHGNHKHPLEEVQIRDTRYSPVK